ncbi:hypothetical protein DAI22_11g108450 [Oryza sativa Japonica Group]|nr:hypothetical protein DAI22_11g108450 [Oryza sativa Japonica Group]
MWSGRDMCPMIGELLTSLCKYNGQLVAHSTWGIGAAYMCPLA